MCAQLRKDVSKTARAPKKKKKKKDNINLIKNLARVDENW